VCGKYFQGRGKSTHAYTHSVAESHHVFLNLSNLRCYCLPDNYEIIDSSLDVGELTNTRHSFTKFHSIPGHKVRSQSNVYEKRCESPRHLGKDIANTRRSSLFSGYRRSQQHQGKRLLQRGPASPFARDTDQRLLSQRAKLRDNQAFIGRLCVRTRAAIRRADEEAVESSEFQGSRLPTRNVTGCRSLEQQKIPDNRTERSH
jgi:hypothetical protein